jgi:hypothetical protein
MVINSQNRINTTSHDFLMRRKAEVKIRRLFKDIQISSNVIEHNILDPNHLNHHPNSQQCPTDECKKR